MGAPTPFFSDPKLNNTIKTIADSLKNLNNNSTEIERSQIRLSVVLEIIFQNSDIFDKHCQFNINRFGSGFISTLNDSGGRVSNLDLPRLNVIVFRFLSEYDLSVSGDLSLEIRSFMDGVLSESVNYSKDLKDQLEYIQNKMSVSIIKDILNSGDFLSLRNVQGIAQSTNVKVDFWNEELAASEKRVNDLQETLKDQTNSFNFVGLSKGFSDLESTIKEELDILQGRITIFGILVLIPVLLEFLSINFGWVNIATTNFIALTASAFASVTATLLLLYFFRINLHSADACKAQLVQVRLRMTLCRFIQNYAEYSNEIKTKNSDALSKFENLIFSGIVSTEDKLPSSFDGIEQLGGLLKAIRGDSK